jgi:hypothetical protein
MLATLAAGFDSAQPAGYYLSATPLTVHMHGLLSRITQIPGQFGGRPCVRGIRIRAIDKSIAYH